LRDFIGSKQGAFLYIYPLCSTVFSCPNAKSGIIGLTTLYCGPIPFCNSQGIEFTRKPLTPFGGIATLVAKFLEVIEFRSWVESAIHIRESSNNSKGIYGKVLAQFLSIISGGFRMQNLG